MGDQPQKDWEKEYQKAFTKKIPFPILKYELCRMNPTIPNLTYTLTTTGIRKETKFELYVQSSTYYDLQPLLEKYRTEKTAFDEKAKKEEEELKLAEVKKTEEAPQNSYYVPPAPVAETKEEFDVAEKALFELTEKRIKEQTEITKNEKEEIKKKEEEKTKKTTKGEDDKNAEDGDENEKDDDQKDKEAEGISADFQYFNKIEAGENYGENLKNCRKVLTLWEFSNRGYRKLNEVFIFETLNNTLEFSSDGKYFMMAVNDSKTFIIYDAQTLTRINKVELKAKDANDYDVTYFYSAQLSRDGSYIITGDSYMRYIFERDGKFIRSSPGKGMYTIYQFSNTEYVG